MSSQITCDGCGACCSGMCSPLFVPEHFGGTELQALPVAIREEFEAGMRLRAEENWPNDVPCFWQTPDLRCGHYEHRPKICREFERGGDDCLAWRQVWVEQDREGKR